MRITQTGSKNRNWWSILELTVSAGSDEPNEPEDNTDSETLDRSNWTLVASNGNNNVFRAIDGSASSRWTTVQTQRTGQWFEIDLSKSESFNKIVLDSQGSSQDYPRQYTLLVSDNGSNWRTIESSTGRTITTMNFSRQIARYIRIEQTGSDSRHWWSIHEVNVYIASCMISHEISAFRLHIYPLVLPEDIVFVNYVYVEIDKNISRRLFNS